MHSSGADQMVYMPIMAASRRAARSVRTAHLLHVAAGMRSTPPHALRLAQWGLGLMAPCWWPWGLEGLLGVSVGRPGPKMSRTPGQAPASRASK